MIFVTVSGVRLEVQRIGEAASPGGPAPIVFLHEGLGSMAAWRDWPEQVCAATGRPGLVYSRRGYGQSDAVPDVRAAPYERDGRRCGRLLPDYMHREALDVLPALLEQLGIEAPVLLGHSDGATIALLHASRHPLAACIVMAPHVFVEDFGLAAIARARDAYAHGDLRGRLARYHADVDCAFYQWNDVWLSPAFRGFDIAADCARIRAPVLAIQGKDDPYGSLEQVDRIARAMQAAAAPGTATVAVHALAACGHSPQREQPAATLALITAFLAGRP